MKISIVTPTRALDHFLEEARAALRRQTADVEIEHVVVVDDGKAALPPDQITGNVHTLFLHNAGGRGPGGARNTGLERVSGAFVFFLDADDIWEDDYVERVLSVYAGHPEVDCVSVAGLSFGEHIQHPRANIPLLPQGIIDRCAVAWNPVGCPSGFSYRQNMITRDVRFKDAIYFQDLILYLDLLRLGAVFWRENSVRYWYRRSPGQLTSGTATETVRESEAVVHRNIAAWRDAGLSGWEAAVASVQIRRLSANRRRRRNYGSTLLLMLMAPSWVAGQIRRLRENARLAKGRVEPVPSDGACASPGV